MKWGQSTGIAESPKAGGEIEIESEGVVRERERGGGGPEPERGGGGPGLEPTRNGWSPSLGPMPQSLKHLALGGCLAPAVARSIRVGML